MSTEVKVSVLPQCNFCFAKATVDGKTAMGPWAYMCPGHFALHGTGLGTGFGQRLILETTKEE